MRTLSLDGNSLTPQEVVQVATQGRKVRLAPAARSRVKACHKELQALVESGAAVYGVNTGFGDLASVRIPDSDLAELQVNLIRSHAAGVGHPIAEEVARGMLVLRANTLAKGASGVRPVVIEAILGLLNQGVTPYLPEHGSLGASGDLAPLAHMALVLLGEGEAFYQGERLPGGEALERAGLEPIALGPKEGLALTNGTPLMTSYACLAAGRARSLAEAAAIAGAMSIEALRGSDRPFRAELAELRGQPGHLRAAALLRHLMDGSQIREDHRDCGKVQDPYSMRCFPQVLGAFLDALAYVEGPIRHECNAATDNPLIVDRDAFSGGNFHGAPIGYPLDLLAIILTDLGSIAERRTFRLLTTFLSDLPPFLTKNGGLHSGMMIPQYTQASLVAECKLRSHPASVDSIPSSADQEDHVSMATHAARKAYEVVGMVENIVAIELMAACQGLEFQRPLKPGKALARVYQKIRKEIPALEGDRDMSKDMEILRGWVAQGEISRWAKISFAGI